MLNTHRAADGTTTGQHEEHHDQDQFRDIHPLTPPRPPPADRPRRWESNSHRSPALSTASEANFSENFTTMSREFNALVLAGSAATTNNHSNIVGNHENDLGNIGNGSNLGRIGEGDAVPEDMNPLAIVTDNNPLDPLPTPRQTNGSESAMIIHGDVSVHRVKKEEVEAKISAWQNAKISKVNNRFKREDAIISGWENEQVHKATSWMKKVERKLEEQRARAMEKMQNDIAKAHGKAEERRASAEAKRGMKVARVLEIANLMRAVGRAPNKRSFF
ncbi:hypothetical protein Nepgr_010016 [Nepenthes gracilis]|uniref:Remorin C-terminal domain-containing protein n=1 Tax=Nepenthes gracilis TaxID=150966 RepID=A0AAD3XKZ5_NEPGR|nr:hypothetical protein Nepgr_010016 [Nepenthes gracilis]